MKTKLRNNLFDSVKMRIVEAARESTVSATENLAGYIKDKLNAAALDLHSDTRALAESLYVRATSGRNDYADALARARQAFADNPSRYRSLPASPQTLANFDALIAAQEAMPERDPEVFVCTCVTMLAYGLHWETGLEERPWMQPGALEWAETQAEAHYRKLKIT